MSYLLFYHLCEDEYTDCMIIQITGGINLCGTNYWSFDFKDQKKSFKSPSLL